MVGLVQPKGLAFDETGGFGAAKGDLSNTRALGVLAQIPSGITDCHAAIMLAVERLDGNPGRIILPQDRNAYLRSDLELPDGVVLQGWGTLGTHDMVNPDAFGPKLWIDSDVSILAGNGAGVVNVPVMRAGLTFGQTSAQRYSTWLGTPFLLKENTSGHVFKRSAILGFRQGIRSENTTAALPVQNITNNRSTFEWLLMNNIDEIWLHNTADIARFSQIHFWPAAQYGAAEEPGAAHIISTGRGVRMTGLNDHPEFTRVFGYGKHRLFDLVDVANASILGCSADYPPGLETEALGLLIRGASKGVQVTDFRASGLDYGMEINSTATDALAASIVNPSVWGVTRAAIRSLDGDVQIIGGGLREDGNVAQGVVTGPNSGATTILGTDFKGFSTAIANYSSATVTRHIGCTFSNNLVNVSNPYAASVPAAAALSINEVDAAYIVTGSDAIGDVQRPGVWAGRSITLRFAGGAVVLESGNIRLKGDVAFRAQPNDTLTLQSDGASWAEVSRSVNGDWVSSFVPNVSSTGGPVGAYVASCEYQRDGDWLDYSITVSVTTNGSGGGALLVTVPFPSAATQSHIGVGRATSGSGQILSATLGPSSNQLAILDDDNGYPVADGSVITINGSYRVAY